LSAVANAQTGSNPSAGPVVSTGGGFPGAGPGHAIPHALVSLLKGSSSRYTWVAAVSSALPAASLELSTGKSVIAIGGFSGRDPSITLDRFEQLVRQGKIHYYVSVGGLGGGPAGGAGAARGGPPLLPGGGPPPGSSAGGGFPGGRFLGGGFPGGGPPAGGIPGAAGPGGNAGNSVESQIQSWVSSHYKSSTVGAVTVFDFSSSKAS
jgi:hypothetical protein